MHTKDKIEQTLKQKFSIHHLEVFDDSHLHAGHSGSREHGGGHFSILIVSDDFEGKLLVQRHRLINDSLKGEFKSAIHALEIKALTRQEY